MIDSIQAKDVSRVSKTSLQPEVPALAATSPTKPASTSRSSWKKFIQEAGPISVLQPPALSLVPDYKDSDFSRTQSRTGKDESKNRIDLCGQTLDAISALKTIAEAELLVAKLLVTMRAALADRLPINTNLPSIALKSPSSEKPKLLNGNMAPDATGRMYYIN